MRGEMHSVSTFIKVFNTFYILEALTINKSSVKTQYQTVNAAQ